MVPKQYMEERTARCLRSIRVYYFRGARVTCCNLFFALSFLAIVFLLSLNLSVSRSSRFRIRTDSGPGRRNFPPPSSKAKRPAQVCVLLFLYHFSFKYMKLTWCLCITHINLPTIKSTRQVLVYDAPSHESPQQNIIQTIFKKRHLKMYTAIQGRAMPVSLWFLVTGFSAHTLERADPIN